MSWTALLGAVILAACTSAANPNTADALKVRQRAIQDCILSGGHAHPGPNNTIWCEGGRS